MLARIDRAESNRYLGDVLQDQRLIAGIGNMWMAETLWHAKLSPWQRIGDVARADRLRVLETAATLMRASVDGGGDPRKNVHGRAGRPCPRCGTPVRSWGQGDANRIAYWCPACQPGPVPSSAHALSAPGEP
jgi:endonuclease-8